MAAMLVLAQHRPHPTIVHSPRRLVDLTDGSAVVEPTTGERDRPALPGPAIMRQPRIELGHDAATGSYHLSITPQLPRW